MRVLPQVAPTPEQMPLLADQRAGFSVIRGAAGSGKTTTALLRLQYSCLSRMNRRERLQTSEPVRVLVLTYNRTLEGYIEALAMQQVGPRAGLELQVSTFSKWAYHLLGQPEMLSVAASRAMIGKYAHNLPGDVSFFIDEVDYLLGRLPKANLDVYPTIPRSGRGISPRIERPIKERLLAEVVAPYQAEKARLGVFDWNDLAKAAIDAPGTPWDVVVVDEAQDFSANQVRGVISHLAEDFTATFVLDATQRIYPRYFSWREAGIDSYTSKRLTQNYRNTRQIAAFARQLVADLPEDDDGALPDFRSCTHDGQLPQVVVGRFSSQAEYACDYIATKVDLENESVAFLHPMGGGWFGELRRQLSERDLDYCEITRLSVWPTGPEAIAISTLYSAKGLEFDHVFILGLNQEVTPHGADEGDTQFDTLRRLVAMGIGRARRTVHIGYKPGEASNLISLLDASTFDQVAL